MYIRFRAIFDIKGPAPHLGIDLGVDRAGLDSIMTFCRPYLQRLGRSRSRGGIARFSWMTRDGIVHLPWMTPTH